MCHIRAVAYSRDSANMVKLLELFARPEALLHHLRRYPSAGQLIRRNVRRIRGLVLKAHRLVYHSTLGSRVVEKKKKKKYSSTRGHPDQSYRSSLLDRRRSSATSAGTPPWRRPRGKLMISSVNPHANATRIGWHLCEIDLRFALNSGSTPRAAPDQSYRSSVLDRRRSSASSAGTLQPNN